MTDKTVDVRKVLPFIWLGGAGLIALGSILPWATASTVFGTLSVNGTHGDGKITLALAVVIGLLAAVSLLQRVSAVVPVVSVMLSVFVVVVAIRDMRNLPNPSSGLVVVDIGTGLWLCLAGGIAAALASGLMFTEYRTPKVEIAPVETPE